MWYVYILLCTGNTLYTGIARNVEDRFEKHREGTGAQYTKSHPPVSIQYVEECDSRSSAQKREYAIKQLSRLEKSDLINSAKNSDIISL